MHNPRVILGVDLGIASAHTVRVIDGEGATLAKRRAWPTCESLAAVEAAALAGCDPDTRLEVVIEPTGPAWLPVAVYFGDRGHTVHRVSSAKANALRRFYSPRTKTNGIDADALARIPLVDPDGLQPLALPATAAAASLDRRTRACDRLTRVGAEHKVRIKDLTRRVLPTSPLTADLGVADLAVLEHYGDPRRLLAAGLDRLTDVIHAASHGHQGPERAQQWIDAAAASVELYGDNPAVAYDDVAAEIATEVRLLRATQTELAAHEAARESAYRAVDPGGLARSLPGVATVSGPALVAAIGDPTRFPTAKQFRSYTGLTPRASETGNTDRKGQPMTKAGSTLLRTTLIRCADTARKQDPQLAAVYHQQMVERGKNHLGALCVVATRLADRLWAVMNRQTPYAICDTDGRPVTPTEAKTIIAERFTVPPDVRARRRSTQTGKAPQKVPTGHSKPHARSAGTRGDLPHTASSPTPKRHVNQRTA